MGRKESPGWYVADGYSINIICKIKRRTLSAFLFKDKIIYKIKVILRVFITRRISLHHKYNFQDKFGQMVRFFACAQNDMFFICTDINKGLVLYSLFFSTKNKYKFCKNNAVAVSSTLALHKVVRRVSSLQQQIFAALYKKVPPKSLYFLGGFVFCQFKTKGLSLRTSPYCFV